MIFSRRYYNFSVFSVGFRLILVTLLSTTLCLPFSDCQSDLDSYGSGRERSLTSDCSRSSTAQLRQHRNASALFLNAGLPRGGDKSQRYSRNRVSKSFVDVDDDLEDDWSGFNSLESLDEGDLEEIQVNFQKLMPGI